MTVIIIGIIIGDANDQKGSQMSAAMLFVLDFNHCYQQKSEYKNRPLSAIHALDCTYC